MKDKMLLVNSKSKKVSLNFGKFSPWMLGLIVGSLILILVEFIIDFKKEELRISAQNEALNYGINQIANLNRELNSVIYLSNGLSAYLKVHANKLEKDEVNEILKETFVTSSLIRNIGIALGTTITFIEPILNNKTAIGIDYKTLPEQWPDVEKAIKNKIGTLSKPVNLVQGGKGIIFRKPIYIENTYWGLISTVLNLDPLFETAFDFEINWTHQFGIKVKNSNEFVFGNAQIFNEPNTVTLEANLPNTTWLFVIETEINPKELFFLDVMQWIGWFFSLSVSAGVFFLMVLHLKNKEAEAQLLRNGSRLNTMINTTHAGVSILNREGKHLFTNEACKQIHGYERTEVLGTFITDVVYKEDKKEILKKIESVLDGKKEVVDFVLRIFHKDGYIVWIQSVVTRLPKLLESDEESVLVYFQNITHQKQIEEELSELNETKDKFFSIIAHDLRSPFAGILGFLEILTDENSDFTELELKDIFKHMLDSTNRTFTLLENLLTWARSQSDGLQFEPENLNSAEKINEVIYLLNSAAQAKSIRLEAKSLVNAEVYADTFLLNTILRNVISNSIKFTPENGQIQLESNLSTDSNFVEVHVIDSGIGMSNEVVENLFRLDRNLRSLGTNQEKGTGLGLHLCKEFVETQGGQIWVSSELGKGSKVSFSIPIAKN